MSFKNVIDRPRNALETVNMMLSILSVLPERCDQSFSRTLANSFKLSSEGFVATSGSGKGGKKNFSRKFFQVAFKRVNIGRGAGRGLPT